MFCPAILSFCPTNNLAIEVDVLPRIHRVCGLIKIPANATGVECYQYSLNTVPGNVTIEIPLSYFPPPPRPLSPTSIPLMFTPGKPQLCRIMFSLSQDIGYVNDRNGGDYTGNPETGTTNSFEEYVLFSGLSGDAMLGEYRIFGRSYDSDSPVAWTLTATVNGVVEWVEEGELYYTSSSDTYHDADDSNYTIRRLFSFTDDDYESDYTSYSNFYLPQTDTFTVTLDSYDPAGC